MTGIKITQIEAVEVDGQAVTVEDLVAAYKAATEREKLRKAREARAKKYNIAVKEGGRLTPPKGYPTAEVDYGDPVNWSYPANAERARAALGYFNHEDAREAGGYSSKEWGIVGKRLAKLISKHLEADYEYKAGKLQKKEGGKALELQRKIDQVRDAWREQFAKPSAPGAEVPWYSVRVFEEPDLAVVERPEGLFAYPYVLGEDGCEFDEPYEVEFVIQRKEGKSLNEVKDNAFKTIARTDDELRVANYIVLFGGRDLEGIASSRVNEDGSRGEYFTPDTEFKSAYLDTGRLLVDWEHGQDEDDGDDVPAPGRDDVLGYVDWKTAKPDERGLWVERVLNRRNAYMRFLDALFDEGLIGNSSEAVPGKVVKADDGAILEWPLRRDTLTVSPMEWRMMTDNLLVTQAVKGLAELSPAFKSVLPEQLQEAIGLGLEPGPTEGGASPGGGGLKVVEARARAELEIDVRLSEIQMEVQT